MKKQLEKKVEMCPFIKKCDIYYKGFKECSSEEGYDDCVIYRGLRNCKEEKIMGKKKIKPLEERDCPEIKKCVHKSLLSHCTKGEFIEHC